MKKLSLLCLAVLCCFSFSANAQWATKATKFSDAGFGTYGISIPNANVAWAIAFDTTFTSLNVEFSRTTDGGNNWTRGTLGMQYFFHQISAISAIDANTAWVTVWDGTTQRGKVFKTTNGGSSWTHQTSAAFAAPDGSPTAIHFFDANNGVVIGDPNGGYLEVYTTTNGGTNWTRVPQANLPAMSGSEWTDGSLVAQGNNLWIATSDGRILRSTNKGLNWTAHSTGASFIFALAFKDAQNGLLNSIDGLMRTTNGGQTWTAVTPTGVLHNGGLAYVPGTANTYVSTGAEPGDEGSSFSTDGGNTWQVLESNLVHTPALKFFNATTGFSGGITTGANAGGIYKFNGSFGTTGIFETVNKESLQVYPNPSKGSYFVNTSDFGSHYISYTVRNSLGQVITSAQDINPATDNKFSLDLSNQPAGIYFLEVSAGKQVMQQRLIKQ